MKGGCEVEGGGKGGVRKFTANHWGKKEQYLQGGGGGGGGGVEEKTCVKKSTGVIKKGRGSGKNDQKGDV